MSTKLCEDEVKAKTSSTANKKFKAFLHLFVPQHPVKQLVKKVKIVYSELYIDMFTVCFKGP